MTSIGRLLAITACGLASLAPAQSVPAPAQLPPARDVRVTAIPTVVAAGATWTLVWAGTDNADGIVGATDGGLLFAQEQLNRVSKLDVNDRVSVATEQTNGTGALTVDPMGRLLGAQRACSDPGLQLSTPCSTPTSIAVLLPMNARRVLADSIGGRSLGRINDLIAARNGSVYFTSGEAFRLSADGRVLVIGEDLRTNGIVLSPDEKTLYITNGGTVAALDVQSDGTVTNQRVFAQLEAGGSGDGLAIDAAGRVYVTSAPGVQVFGNDGGYLGLIPTPRNVISVAFAGRDKRMLYVVGSGARNPQGQEILTPNGVRNNAKSIYKLPMIAQGFLGRAK